jgi:ribonuclease HI
MRRTTTAAPPEQFYTAYVAGSCKGNPGPGGYAYTMEASDGTRTAQSFHHADTTSNRAVLMAAIEVIKVLPPGVTLELRADNEYLVTGSDRLRLWEKDGWKIKGKPQYGTKDRPVINADLWKEIYGLLRKAEVWFQWSGEVGPSLAENERAKDLARAAAAGEIYP